MIHGQEHLSRSRHARYRAAAAEVPRWPVPIPVRSSVSLTLVIAGGILLFAVSLTVPDLSLQIAGLILLAVGLAGLRLPQRAWRWARAHSDDLRFALDELASEPEPEAERVPLDTLLGP